MARFSSIVNAPTQQQLVDYQNAVAAVNLYAYAITQTSMPVLNDPPPDYAQFTTELAPAKAHCLTWSNSTFPLMLSFPQTIINASSLFSSQDTNAAIALQNLVNNPNDTVSKTALATNLQNMLEIVNGELTTAQNLASQFSAFTKQISGDTPVLTQIAGQALNDANVTDQKQIAQLNADIANLNSQISSKQTWLTISEVGIPVSIFVGLIGAAVCTIPGAQLIGAGIIVLAVAGLAASITFTVILSNEIKALQQDITSDAQTVQQIDQDVIQLQAVAAQFNQLEQFNVAAQNAMATVTQLWVGLQQDLQAALEELTTTKSDVTAAQYQQALNDLGQAAIAWDAVVTYAQALANVNYQWQDSSGAWHTYGDGVQIQEGGATVVPIQQQQAA